MKIIVKGSCTIELENGLQFEVSENGINPVKNKEQAIAELLALTKLIAVKNKNEDRMKATKLLRTFEEKYGEA